MSRADSHVLWICLGLLLSTSTSRSCEARQSRERDVQILTLLQHKEHGDKGWCYR